MGCGKSFNGNGNDVEVEDIFTSNECVADVARAIAGAQDSVTNTGAAGCDVSCVRSINDLLGTSPVTRNNVDTVPVILYGKKLEPFKAFGADFEMNRGRPRFDCTESFIFRINEVSDEGCAVLELLTFDEEEPDQPGNQQGANGDDDPCEQIDNEFVDDLNGTGICITVDLECFCAITCLPAVSIR